MDATTSFIKNSYREYLRDNSGKVSSINYSAVVTRAFSALKRVNNAISRLYVDLGEASSILANKRRQYARDGQFAPDYSVIDRIKDDIEKLKKIKDHIRDKAFEIKEEKEYSEAFKEMIIKINNTVSEKLNESKEDTLKLVNHVGQELSDRFLKYKNLLKSPENDLYYWIKKDPIELEDRLNELSSVVSNTKQKELDKIKGAELVTEGNGYKVYLIKTKAASCQYGKGTKWCISALSDNQFNHYTSKGVKFYFFIKNDEKYALALYPEIFEKKSEGFKTNFALYNSEDKLILEYKKIKALNLPEIPGVELVYEFKRIEIKDNILLRVYDHNIENGTFIIPNNVTEIGEDAFSYCKSLKSINIPNNVIKIGDYDFAGCTSLPSIELPDNIEIIGSWAFASCTSLTSITIPNSVNEISDNAFRNCTSLTSITIPNSVTGIGDYAFCYCESLTSITIPSSVTSIGDSAFSSCKNLKSIIIPNSVTQIGVHAFYYCTSLESIICEEDNETYRKLKEEYGGIVKLKSKNEALTEGKINLKSIHYWKNPETDEWNPTIIIDGKKARLRAGIIIIKDGDKILLGEEEQEPGVFSLPGGAIEKGENPVETAIREAKEEVYINVKNAKETGYDYCVKHEDAMPWVKKHIPQEEWWYHYYTCLVIADYDGEYKGKVAEKDKDSSLYNSSKFYNIKDVINKPSFKPEWKKALIKFGYIEEQNSKLTENKHSYSDRYNISRKAFNFIYNIMKKEYPTSSNPLARSFLLPDGTFVSTKPMSYQTSYTFKPHYTISGQIGNSISSYIDKDSNEHYEEFIKKYNFKDHEEEINEIWEVYGESGFENDYDEGGFRLIEEDGCVRLNGDKGQEHYIVLPDIDNFNLTYIQYQKLLSWLDIYFMKDERDLEITDRFANQDISYSPAEYISEDIINKIKYYYRTGELKEDLKSQTIYI